MNTVKQFLDATGFNRGSNYPSVTTLKAKMTELEVTVITLFTNIIANVQVL